MLLSLFDLDDKGITLSVIYLCQQKVFPAEDGTVEDFQLDESMGIPPKRKLGLLGLRR